MSVFIAMIRGINVGGKSVKMDKLRNSLKAPVFRDVRTYVQSGNIIFQTTGGSPASFSDKIEKLILRDFGFSVSVLIRTQAEMATIIKRNPFPPKKGIDVSRLYVTFLSGTPTISAIKQLEPLDGDSDQFHLRGREIYLYCPNGYGRTKLSNNLFERLLSLPATTRNWNTVNTLFELSSKQKR